MLYSEFMTTTVTTPAPSLGPVELEILSTLARHHSTSLVLRRDSPWLRTITQRPDGAVRRMVAKGRLVPVGTGRYVARSLAADFGDVHLRVQDAVEAWLAGYEYYVGFHTALSEHGLTDLDDPVTYLAVFGQRELPNRLGVLAEVQVQVARTAVHDRWFGTQRVDLGDAGSYRRSDLERTLLDAIERPDLSGSMQTVVRAWARAIQRERVNLRRLCEYATRLGPAAVRRTGYWLEMLGADQRYVKSLLRRRGTMGPVLLDRRGDTSGPTDWRWRVRLNVDKESARAWIAYGK